MYHGFIRKTRSISVLLLFLFFSGFLGAQDTVRIGVLAYRGEVESNLSWQPTVDFLNIEFPEKQFKLVPLLFEELEPVVKKKAIDLLICNPANFVLLQQRYNVAQIATVERNYQHQKYTSYGSVFITQKENKRVQNVKDIKGKSVAVVDRLSMGGCMLPKVLLKNQGVDLLNDVKTLVYTHNHDEVVNSVSRGLIDVGIVRTGILEEMAFNQLIDLDDIRILNAQTHPGFPFLISTGLVPEWPLAKLQHFSDFEALEIARKLITYQPKEIESSYVSISWSGPSDYSDIIHKLKIIKAPPFEDSKMSFRDSFGNDWHFFFLLFLLSIVLVVFIIFARYTHRKIKPHERDENKGVLDSLKTAYSPFNTNASTIEAKCAAGKYHLKDYFSLKSLTRIAVVALIYYLTIQFGYLFAVGQTENTAIWFAAGIGFLAIYIFGCRVWPAIFIGAFLINLFSVNFSPEFPGFVQLLIYCILNSAINVFEGIFGVFLVRRIIGNKPLFSEIQSTVKFIIIVGIALSLFVSFFGSTLFAYFSSDWEGYYLMLITWWLGDAIGLMLLVPLVLTAEWPKSKSSRRKQVYLFLVFLVLLVLTGLFIFNIGYHIAYLFLPFFIYFTFRFGRFPSLIMVFFLSLVSIWVVTYLEMYWLWNTPNEGLFYVRLFIIILLLTVLLMSAVLSEQYLAEGRMLLYKKIVQNSIDGVAIIDANGHYIEQNDANQALIGYRDEELVGKTPEIHFGHEVFTEILEKLGTHKTVHGEWLSNTRFGPKSVDLSAFTIHDESNQIVCHVGIKRDVTEKKIAEEKLRKSEAEAWSLFEHAAIPIMIEDFSEIKIYIDKLIAAGLTDWEAYFEENPDEISKLASLIKVIEINTSMSNFYGEGSDEKHMANLLDFFSEESLIVFQQEIIALAQGNYTFSSIIPLKGIHGENLYFILSLAIPPLYQQNFERVIVSFVDITENKRAEQIQKILLNISNAANKANNVQETIMAVHQELGTLLDASNFFLAIYDEITDEITLPFFKDENDIIDRLPAGKTLTAQVVRSQSSLLVNEKELQDLEAKGIIKPIGKPAKTWLGVPLKVKGKAIGAFVVQSYTNENAYNEKDKETLEIIANQIALNIERKQAEQEILFALGKAQESDQIKSAFLSSMSHELRTPLNAIIGFSNLIDKDLDAEQATVFAEMIHKSGINLLHIVDGIFEVSLIDGGNQKAKYGSYLFDTLMNDIFQTILTRQKVLNKPEVKIVMLHKIDVDKEIYTDSEKLKNIFLHLLSNALKFTHQGTVSFGLESRTAEGLTYFYVQDTGIGIPKEKQSIIFERFRMGDDTHTRQYEGMGIGLFICKKLIELLGGGIHLESEENQGSRFIFYVPLHKTIQI
ncbi:MAG: PhnD/SsuA/transferrin family substrate-binding protein [Bacteroidales bacterium]|nr:PhnD/SsuA/transferrin family substrate-binding protein [Bacteroidales bacterium]